MILTKGIRFTIMDNEELGVNFFMLTLEINKIKGFIEKIQRSLQIEIKEY